MPVYRLPDLVSPRLDPFRNLRTTNLTRVSGRFIAESKPLVQRLVASGMAIDSVLIDEKYLDEAVGWLPPATDLFVVSSDHVSELIGFAFHRGYLACGIRPKFKSLEEVSPSFDLNSKWLGVLLVGLQDPENMGSIFRTCAALGISDVLIGPDCVDPFARRVLRVSMGNAFKLRFMEASQPIAAMDYCRGMGIESIAACLAKTSEELSLFRRSSPGLVVFGNEAHGLPESIQVAASRSVRIDMALGTDSLNVSVAAGIILHNLARNQG
jgi:tRNA G18 (ribose-2'-O)-methylase SpoU